MEESAAADSWLVVSLGWLTVCSQAHRHTCSSAVLPGTARVRVGEESQKHEAVGHFGPLTILFHAGRKTLGSKPFSLQTSLAPQTWLSWPVQVGLGAGVGRRELARPGFPEHGGWFSAFLVLDGEQQGGVLGLFCSRPQGEG